MALALYAPSFGYGSNLSFVQMKERCPDNVYSCTAKLDNWKWIINERGFATIKPSTGDHVWGMVFLLHKRDEQELDQREGPNYLKTLLQVKLTGVENHPGSVVIYIDNNTTLGRPGPDYIMRLRRAMADGKAQGIPQEYFDKYWEPFLPPEQGQTRG